MWLFRMRPRLTPEQLADIYETRRKAAAEIAAATRQAVIVDYLRWRAEQLACLEMFPEQGTCASLADEIESGKHLKPR